MRLSFLFVCVVVSAYGFTVDQKTTCVSKCKKNYSGDMAASCMYGCERADFLKLHESDKLHSSCHASCIKKYLDEGNRNTCKEGCNLYSENENSLFSSPLSLFNKLFHLHNSLEDANETSASSDDKPHPVRLIVIRRFRLRVPSVEQPEPEGRFNDEEPAHEPFPLIPYSALPKLHDEPQHPSVLEGQSHMTKMASIEAGDTKLTRTFHYMGSHPLIILFAITLLALCVLLVVQVTLECKRRRRATQFQFTQFDQLPSYVEATTVKIPADGNQNSGATNDSNKA